MSSRLCTRLLVRSATKVPLRMSSASQVKRLVFQYAQRLSVLIFGCLQRIRPPLTSARYGFIRYVALWTRIHAVYRWRKVCAFCTLGVSLTSTSSPPTCCCTRSAQRSAAQPLLAAPLRSFVYATMRASLCYVVCYLKYKFRGVAVVLYEYLSL